MSRPRWADDFLEHLRRQVPLDWLEVRITRDGDGPTYRLHHRLDPPGADLTPVDDWRELARTDAAGDYRPLPTAPDLRRGWSAAGLTEDALLAALETLYPAAIALWSAERAGRLEPVAWRAVQRRQTGQQGLLKRLDDADLRLAVEAHCAGGCLRRVVWSLDQEQPPAMTGAGQVPCPEACSLLLSFARELVGWRRGETVETDSPAWRRLLALQEERGLG